VTIRAAITALIVASCSSPAREPAKPIAKPPADDHEALRRLDLKFGTTGTIAVTADRRETFRAFLRERMTQKAFYESALRAMKLIRAHSEPPAILPPLPLTLQQAESVYFLDQPCATKDAVDVAPWWDLKSTVRVCRDSYAPEITSYPAGDGATVSCDSTFYQAHKAWVKSPCKCGANLMNCAPSTDVQNAILDGFADEQTLTAKYVVENHRPFGEILSLPGSVRSGYADVFYARSQFLATGTWSYDKPDREAKFRPRSSPFDAGILSTWPWMVKSDSYRITARDIWEQYLCHPLASRNVTPAEILKATGGTSALGRYRDSVRMEFTTAPGCQNCHKILENASRTMTGFTLMQYGGHYDPARAYDSTIQFFVDDITTPRAEGPATLKWLGQTIAAQPEFDACVVKKVLDYVYDGFPYSPELAQRLDAAFTKGQDFAALFEDAVVARFVGSQP
jgi:hypothetical protein